VNVLGARKGNPFFGGGGPCQVARIQKLPAEQES
jgi:hypothetical protein